MCSWADTHNSSPLGGPEWAFPELTLLCPSGRWSEVSSSFTLGRRPCGPSPGFRGPGPGRGGSLRGSGGAQRVSAPRPIHTGGNGSTASCLSWRGCQCRDRAALTRGPRVAGLIAAGDTRGGFAAAEGAVGTSRVRLNGSHSRAGWTSLALRPPPFCAPPSPGRSPSRIAGLGGVSRCSSLASRFSASWTPRLPRHTRHMPQGNRAFSPAPENEGRKLLPDCVTAD